MPIKLRSGKILKKIFKQENQPFKLILAPEKFPPACPAHQKAVCIDFDEASREWRKNKISLGGGMFKYINK